MLLSRGESRNAMSRGERIFKAVLNPEGENGFRCIKNDHDGGGGYVQGGR